MLSPPVHKSHLPLELIDTVIDELSSDTSSLLSCSLVHSTWCIRAQYHLFRDITLSLVVSPITQADKQQGLMRFAGSVTAKPELAHLVHCLTIQGYASAAADDWETPIQDVTYLETRCNALARVIPLLRWVHTVTLESLFESTDWGNLPYPLQSAIFDLIFQSSVVELGLLSVEGMPFLPVLLSHHLQHLELRDLVPDPAELDAPFPLNARYDVGHISDVSRRSSTCALVLDNDADSLILRYWLMGNAAWLSTLTSLLLGSSAWSEPNTRADLLKLFGLVRNTLNTYEVKQVGFLEWDDPQIFSKSLLRLDLMPNLQTLLFELNRYYLTRIPEHRDIMNDIAEALKLLAVPGNVLKSFRITITFDHPDNPEANQQIHLPRRWFEQWAALDDVLSSPCFSSLAPSTDGDAIVFKASVTLDFDLLKCQYLPVPSGNTGTFIQILERMKTLQINCLPVKWSDSQERWTLQPEQQRSLLSSHILSACNDCVAS
ncbi:hypothetical protein BKA70DRAFT_1558430 [Coprinopsis sp. MPI-PUGE-AT-0042]|nr:hypothetical protein BKA70DRAFT_1558430 [Coprinopsis sp. MPI-PUGE-AT-0042]